MSFSIPEPFEWDESFQVFYDSLDEQHQGLFKAIFSVARCPNDEDVLRKLVNVMEEHFEHEEALLRKAKYADYDAHKQAHREFQKALRSVSSPVSAEKVDWIKEWLVNHIKGTDFKYKGKLEFPTSNDGHHHHHHHPRHNHDHRDD